MTYSIYATWWKQNKSKAYTKKLLLLFSGLPWAWRMAVAEKMDDRLNEMNKLVTFLDNHYTTIDKSREYVLNAVKNTDDIFWTSETK